MRKVIAEITLPDWMPEPEFLARFKLDTGVAFDPYNDCHVGGAIRSVGHMKIRREALGVLAESRRAKEG